MKTHLLLSLFIILLCACSPNKQTERLFLQADSLMEAQPDSALRLLQTLPTSQKLSTRETAHYALLLACATDKCEMSLLPCDSLLNIALNYYGKNEKERATALLYKGRLEVEMKQGEKAIEYLLEGLNIIKKFPKEIEINKHLLSSIGNIYFDERLYEESRKAYQEQYKYSTTNKDKSIVLNNLSSYYSMVGKVDSTFILLHKSLEYATIANDSSMLAISALNLSVEYNLKEETDTALYYARMSLQWLPQQKKRNKYYSNLGDIFLERGDNDSAAYYIEKGLENNIDLESRGSNLLNLSYIKEEQGEYQAATSLLYQFVDIIDSIYFNEQSTNIEQLIHKYDIQVKTHEEQIKGRSILLITVAFFVLCCLLIALFYQHRINKREKLQLINEQKLTQAQEKLAAIQTSINENQRIIALLQKEHIILMQEKTKTCQEIHEREVFIEQLISEKSALRNLLFKQNSIYNKVEELSKQKVSNPKELKVLSNTEQKKLMEVILEIYNDFITNIKKQYPLLTNEDLLYLCLCESGLSTQTISFCLGNIGTHALAQRKYRINKYMKSIKLSKCDSHKQ